MRKWIALPRSSGRSTRQAHVGLPRGTYERELGREGFFGPSTQMLHRHPPTGWEAIEGPLRPRAFDTARLDANAPSPLETPVLLANPHLRLSLWRAEKRMDHLVRNADGDELLFVHEGAGDLFCDYGHLRFRDGDYLLLPRGTMWRIVPAAPVTLLLIEATNDSYRLPEKGLVGEHAIFDAGVLDAPTIDKAFRDQAAQRGKWRVRIKRRDKISTMRYPHNPLDAVGWHGTLTPVRLNWRDIRPLMSHRVHLPPSAHTTFVAGRFVVCTFCPRPIESDPAALQVPFFHSNDDYDEVIFYHRGQFFSRDDIHPGMITLHPAGLPHGPHPRAFEIGATAARKETDEVAVMVDARDALEVAEGGLGVEQESYVDSWKSVARKAKKR